MTAVSAKPRMDIRKHRLLTLRGDPLILALEMLCALFILVAIFAPLIAPYPPNKTDILNASAAPSAIHLLGTDDKIGRAHV